MNETQKLFSQLEELLTGGKNVISYNVILLAPSSSSIGINAKCEYFLRS
jgi:hypothetical protein